jgi:hypothetical protein
LRERDAEALAGLMRANSQHALRDYLHHLDTRVERELARTRAAGPDA